MHALQSLILVCYPLYLSTENSDEGVDNPDILTHLTGRDSTLF